MESANAAKMTVEQFMVRMMVLVCFKHRSYYQYFDVWNLHLQLDIPEEELQELVDKAVEKGWIKITHQDPRALRDPKNKLYLYFRMTDVYPEAIFTALSEKLFDRK